MARIMSLSVKLAVRGARRGMATVSRRGSMHKISTEMSCFYFHLQWVINAERMSK